MIHHKLPVSKSFFTTLQNINKNIIISNYSIQISDTTPEKILTWINKLEHLFSVLYSNNLILKNNEKIEMAVMKMNEELFTWYNSTNKTEEWCKLKQKILQKYTNINNEEKKLFCINKWVKITNVENKVETGLISKILSDGFYEVVCKGKIMKIHQISLEEY
ncbi:hypothetical protein BDAP_002169 [Binucleata daphniae]